MDLTALNNQNIDDCGHPILTLSANGDCDTSGIAPGRGKTIFESVQVKPSVYDPYKRSINIRACVTRIPRDITRQISFNCRTQKVESFVKYAIQGYDSFTPEKMDEIEMLFHGRDIYVNGIKVVFAGGTVFDPLSKELPNEYRLNVEVQECTQRIVYGCGDGGNCAPIVTKFIIPDDASGSIFYDSGLTKVASDYSGLLDYYRNQTDNIRVTDISGSVSLNCDYYKVFEVESYNNSPDYFYYDQSRPAYRVYGKIVQSDSELCSGLPASSGSECSAPALGAPIVTDATCSAPTLGTPVVLSSVCPLTIVNNWMQGNEITSLDKSGGTYTLNLSLKKTLPIDSLTRVAYGSTGSKVCYWTSSEFIGKNVYDIESVTVDGIDIADTLWIFDGEIGSMTFIDPCVTPVNSLIVTFRGGESITPTINETIAVIGADCLPSIDKVFTNADTADIPVGTTVTVKATGEITWNGPVTTSGGDAIILLINLQYT